MKELKKDCFDTPKLRDWCFAQDNGANPQMKHARFYADNFDKMQAENIGYLLWGNVGTGKSFFAACIATNLSLDELQHPQDTPHARIYDRLLEMCAPILFTGTNFRRQTAQSKLDRLKTMMKEKECL